MTAAHPVGPIEIRVLEALTSGPLSAPEVALRIGQPETAVSAALEQSVVEQLVTRIKLTKAPAYSLTPKGMHGLAVHQGEQPAPVAPDGVGPVRPEVPPPVTAQTEATDRGPEAAAPPELPAPAKVHGRHLAYAVSYVVLGLLILVFLHSVVGVLAILVGVGLGAWTLRPLLVHGSTTPGR